MSRYIDTKWLEALERKVRADKADRKTDNSSEKPNNCETCKWWEEDTSFCYSKADSDDHACHYERSRR